MHKFEDPPTRALSAGAAAGRVVSLERTPTLHVFDEIAIRGIVLGRG